MVDDDDVVLSYLEQVRNDLSYEIQRDCVVQSGLSAGGLRHMPNVRRSLAGLTAESIARLINVEVAIQAVQNELPNAEDFAFMAVDGSPFYTHLLANRPGAKVTLH